MLLKKFSKQNILSMLLAASFFTSTTGSYSAGDAVSIGVVRSPMPPPMSRINPARAKKRPYKAPQKRRTNSRTQAGNSRGAASRARSSSAGKKPAHAPVPVRAPQDLTSNLAQATIAPGVVHKCHRGSLNINILDIDLNNPDLEVKPVLAGESFNRLDEVLHQAQKVNAIAAVNANYFKHDGTPLGTLIIDGEWIAGSLYDRISFGLSEKGTVHVDRASLHGVIETSNPELKSMWVNNINQPRRTGSKLVAYTRRWGSQVFIPYAGTLVAVDASGRVVDKTLQKIAIPYGGFVLSDSKSSPINKLKRGDLVFLEWQPKPESWSNVVQAVSGGPTLIKDGNLYVDLKDEKFRKTWTSSTIHARTALGVTANRHLILTTIEGPHTMWDLAKMLHKLGCVDALNLDGGGSTTMVVGNKIVTRNKNTYQRRVAASLAVVHKTRLASLTSRNYSRYVPESEDLSSIFNEESPQNQIINSSPELADPLVNAVHERVLKSETQSPLESDSNKMELPAAPPIEYNSKAQSQGQSEEEKGGFGRALKFGLKGMPGFKNIKGSFKNVKKGLLRK